MPALTRSLLGYRYRRLPAAGRQPDAHGYPGAMFPWQSGSDGREETQRLHLNPLSGRWTEDAHLPNDTSAWRSPTTCGSTSR